MPAGYQPDGDPGKKVLTEMRPQIEAALSDAGESIASEARRLAPRRSGAGADSIHYELNDWGQGPEARVSYDSDHFYMMFQELGTRYQRPRPFLRPAMDGFR